MSREARWEVGAVEAVERSINGLVDTFIRYPFLHRREHSLHVDLYQSLTDQPELNGLAPIGATGYETRLVHKEWPTTVPMSLRQRAKRLQSYDLGVLSPNDLTTIESTAAFARGKPPARIAVELSLDYSLKHLEGDIEKFRLNAEELDATSWAPIAYLVHFTRVPSGHSAKVAELIEATAKMAKIKVAFAQLDQISRTWRVWRLGADDFD
jgi:hypothetical protein